MKIELEQTIFNQPVLLLGGLERTIGILTSTAPNVYANDFWKNDGATRTITDFLSGQVGQMIRILGDGNLTIANNTNIITNTGANKLLALNKIYTFHYYDDLVWHENA